MKKRNQTVTSADRAASGGAEAAQGTIDRLLEAATAAFAEAGFHGARVDAIAAAAAVNKRMLYHYFTDKAGLYQAVLAAFPVPAPPPAPADERALLTWIAAVRNTWTPEQIRILAWVGLDGMAATDAAPGRPWDAVAGLVDRIAQVLAGFRQRDGAPASGTVDATDRHLALLLLGGLLLPTICPGAAAAATGSLPGEPGFANGQDQAMLTLIKALYRLQAPKTRLKLQPALRPGGGEFR